MNFVDQFICTRLAESARSSDELRIIAHSGLTKEEEKDILFSGAICDRIFASSEAEKIQPVFSYFRLASGRWALVRISNAPFADSFNRPTSWVHGIVAENTQFELFPIKYLLANLFLVPRSDLDYNKILMEECSQKIELNSFGEELTPTVEGSFLSNLEFRRLVEYYEFAVSKNVSLNINGDFSRFFSCVSCVCSVLDRTEARELSFITKIPDLKTVHRKRFKFLSADLKENDQKVGEVSVVEPVFVDLLCSDGTKRFQEWKKRPENIKAIDARCFFSDLPSKVKDEFLYADLMLMSIEKRHRAFSLISGIVTSGNGEEYLEFDRNIFKFIQFYSGLNLSYSDDLAQKFENLIIDVYEHTRIRAEYLEPIMQTLLGMVSYERRSWARLFLRIFFMEYLESNDSGSRINFDDFFENFISKFSYELKIRYFFSEFSVCVTNSFEDSNGLLSKIIFNLLDKFSSNIENIRVKSDLFDILKLPSESNSVIERLTANSLFFLFRNRVFDFKDTRMKLGIFSGYLFSLAESSGVDSSEFKHLSLVELISEFDEVCDEAVFLDNMINQCKIDHKAKSILELFLVRLLEEIFRGNRPFAFRADFLNLVNPNSHLFSLFSESFFRDYLRHLELFCERNISLRFNYNKTFQVICSRSEVKESAYPLLYAFKLESLLKNRENTFSVLEWLDRVKIQVLPLDYLRSVLRKSIREQLTFRTKSTRAKDLFRSLLIPVFEKIGHLSDLDYFHGFFGEILGSEEFDNRFYRELAKEVAHYEECNPSLVGKVGRMFGNALECREKYSDPKKIDRLLEIADNDRVLSNALNGASFRAFLCVCLVLLVLISFFTLLVSPELVEEALLRFSRFLEYLLFLVL